MGLDDVQQKVLVAHVRQAGLLLSLGHVRHVIDFFLLNAGDVPASFSGEGRLGQELLPCLVSGCGLRTMVAARNSGDEPVYAEGFFIEEETGSHAVINLTVHTLFFESWRINAKLCEQAPGFFAVRERRFNGEGSAVGQQQTSSGTKLITLRVAAEVVVIIENKDASRVPNPFAIEVSGGETAHARAYDNEVV